jgi:UDP-glucuronate 4-epimerase
MSGEKRSPILITGGAGFIGYHLAKRLLETGHEIVAFDDLNGYYKEGLKEARLEILKAYGGFRFIRGDLAEREEVEDLFRAFSPETVVNLAAQAGVRYSIDNPEAYIRSNIVGFFHVLEACRRHGTKHLVYASSSSVYGGNQKVPFSTQDKVSRPVSLYAATKASDELMAYAYSQLYAIPATGLRFFTVYGPYGRPDMAYYSFTKKILAGEPIKIFNHGDMYRDFTYVDDVSEAVARIAFRPPDADENGVRHRLYNVGNNKPEKLMDFISVLEKQLKKEAVKEFLPMQQGDVYRTYADITELQADFDFSPHTSIEEGLRKFAEWYAAYYHTAI